LETHGLSEVGRDIDGRINDRGFFERILSEREKLDAERDRRMEERFRAQEKENRLHLAEMQRRLTDLNHAHEQTRQKERDFVSREAYETFTIRTADDFTTLRAEIRAASVASDLALKAAAEALASTLIEQNRTNETRFGKVENTQAKMIGGLILCSLLVPALTGVVVFLLTRDSAVIALLIR